MQSVVLPFPANLLFCFSCPVIWDSTKLLELVCYFVILLICIIFQMFCSSVSLLELLFYSVFLLKIYCCSAILQERFRYSAILLFFYRNRLSFYWNCCSIRLSARIVLLFCHFFERFRYSAILIFCWNLLAFCYSARLLNSFLYSAIQLFCLCCCVNLPLC